MLDSFERTIDYMRMSITDCCNLRCRYCMPSGMVVKKLPMEQILTYEELIEIAEAAVECGITKFKVTGGEPFARKDCAEFIRMMKNVSGVEQVTITTNGVMLYENLPKLIDAGIDGINVSLDTLKPEVFRDITGFDSHDEVMRGIEAAIEAGLKLKVNTVLQKGINDSEWINIAELARYKKMDVRFIEVMPIGQGKGFEVISNEKLISELKALYPELQKDSTVHGNGPAKYVKIPGFMGSIGFISAIHGKFCDTCNRIRLTVRGSLKPCLCYDSTYDLMSALRDGQGDPKGDRNSRRRELLQIIRQAVKNKPLSHCFETVGEITETRRMSEIGG